MLVLILAFGLLSACVHTPVIDRIHQKGELVVGTAASMPPLNMTTKEGEIIGFEVDLARFMAEDMGVNLRLEPMPFPELLPALEAGKVDMILSGMTMTPKRNLKVAFVGPYFISGKSFLTKTQTFLSVKDPGEVNSPATTLAALKDSTSQTFVEQWIPKARLVTTKDYDEAIEMLIQGKVQALVADYPICLVSVFRYPDQELAALTVPLSYEPIGIAVPAGDPLLINWLENFLNAFEATGEMEALKKIWFEDASWLKKLP
jgi:polar amino acid transport system substrate-binding protein